MLQTKDVIKQYGNYTALNNINLSVPKGSIYGLLGPNGAGKTTLMRIINRITAPDSGEVWLDGIPLQNVQLSEIGYMPEERGLYKKMKIGEQALYLAQLKGMSEQDASKQLKYWFEKLEILSWWNKKVEELSKGMSQKIQFVVTVVHQPKLLIFDEPFSGFDPINAAIIRKEIIDLSKQGTTIILSTHRMETVEEICDHIALIHQAKTILEGPINTIRNQFSDNSFEVIIKNTEISENPFFHLISKEKDVHLLQLKENIKNKDAIAYLNQHHELISFKKRTPSMEDIFIKMVKNE